MIKHFCDICEEELDAQRINRNNLIVPVADKTVAIAMQVEGIDEPSICEACLFWWAERAKEKYFNLGDFAEVAELNAEDIKAMGTGILKIQPTEEQQENGGTHNEGKSTA